MSVWDEGDARGAIGAGHANSSAGDRRDDSKRREVAVVLKSASLREDSATDSRRIGTLPKGTVLLVMRSTEDGLFVAHSDEGQLQFGWVDQQNVKRFP